MQIRQCELTVNRIRRASSFNSSIFSLISIINNTKRLESGSRTSDADERLHSVTDDTGRPVILGIMTI